jgi:hypothetical protein
LITYNTAAGRRPPGLIFLRYIHVGFLIAESETNRGQTTGVRLPEPIAHCVHRGGDHQGDTAGANMRTTPEIHSSH